MRARRSPLLAVLVFSQLAGFLVAVVVVAAAAPTPPTGARFVYGVLAGLAGVIGLAAFYRGLAVAAMGVVAPIAATALFVPLVVGFAQGERPSMLQDAGIGLAVVGVMLVSRERDADRSSRIAAGAAFALFAAACFGLALVGLSAASKGGVLWGALSLRVGGMVPIALAAVLLRQRHAITVQARDAMWLALVGTTDSVANFLYAGATTRGLLSVVAVVASLYPVLVVVLARVLLHERLASAQLAGAAAALAGVALLSAG